MRKFDVLGLSFEVTDAQMRADVSDEDYKMLLLLAVDNLTKAISASTTGGEIVSDSVPIPNGATSIAITFPTPFDATPVITGLAIIKPGAGNDDVFPGDPYSLSAAGFTLPFSATVPASGYLLHYSAK